MERIAKFLKGFSNLLLVVGVDGPGVIGDHVARVAVCRGHIIYLVLLLVGGYPVELCNQIFFNGTILNKDTLNPSHLFKVKLFRLRYPFLGHLQQLGVG